MEHRNVREALHAADPNLKIVSGHVTHKGAANKGETCSKCGKEYFRGRGGLCYPCWEAKVDAEPEIRDTTGMIEWLPEATLKRITHASRKPKTE